MGLSVVALSLAASLSAASIVSAPAIVPLSVAIAAGWWPR